MSDSNLQLEKINAQRITSLEDRLERSVSHLDSKIDKVLDIVSSKSNGSNGNGYVVKSVSVVFAILLPFLGLGSTLGYHLYMNTMDRISTHELLEAHPEALKNNAGTRARMEGMSERINSLDERVENFKQERARINTLEKHVAVIEDRTGGGI